MDTLTVTGPFAAGAAEHPTGPVTSRPARPRARTAGGRRPVRVDFMAGVSRGRLAALTGGGPGPTRAGPGGRDRTARTAGHPMEHDGGAEDEQERQQPHPCT